MDTPQSILVIIHNPDVQSRVRRALDASDLRDARYTLAQSSDAPAALARAPCDCVLLDMGMPAADVEAVVAAVRQARPQPAIVALLPDGFAPRAGAAPDVEQYLPLAALTPAMLALSVRNAVRMKRAAPLELLGGISRLLAAAEDYDARLASVAQCIVEHVADWCAIDLMIDGDLTRAVLAARTPASVRVTMFPDRASNRHAAAFFPPAAIHTGRTQVYSDVAMPGETQAAALISVPLRARGQLLGAMTFVRHNPSARFGAADRDLAEEIGRRIAMAVDNELLYRTSQEAMRARDVFLSVAAHELKTPLTALLGYATLLKRRLERGLQQPERDLRGVKIMVEQAQRLSKLLNTLLDIARMPHAPLQLEHSQCDLPQLMRRVTDEMRPMLRYHTLDVRIPDDRVVVAGDAERLEMVLHNLLQNAVQYSPSGGVIVVTLVHDDTEACVSVQDHGVGIPREALPRIFGRFYRATDTSVHTATGMGVGLYIVKQIVESHGGYVDVQSVEGIGSTFTVCLPLYHPHEHAGEVAA